MTAIQKIRPSPIAGSWYSGDEKKLRAQVNGFMERAHPAQVPGELIGLVSPHAGYAYSGPTAGYSYACVQGKSYDLVVIASPLHEYLPYPFITSAHAIYGTPLGNVPVDVDLLERLQTMVQEQAGINIVAVANDPEHSLEIQLPFLQCALANPFSLLPIMVRSEDPTSLQQFGTILAELIRGKKVLLVASTDLSHFFTLDQAEILDKHMLAQIQALSPDGVLQAERENTGFACGSGAVAVILWAAKALGADTVTLLHHSTSAESTHDESQVVGYGAAAISRTSN
jgi:AmmeMemoRadiSam system protein B